MPITGEQPAALLTDVAPCVNSCRYPVDSLRITCVPYDLFGCAWIHSRPLHIGRKPGPRCLRVLLDRLDQFVAFGGQQV